MNVDDRRFLRRHWPGFVEAPERADGVLGGATLAVRSDGMAFYAPDANPAEVWVAWLAPGPVLKSTPAARRLCSLAEYDNELEARRLEASRLFEEVPS